MKKLIAIIGVLSMLAVSIAAPSSTISLAWTPGDNPTGTQHLIFWGVASGVYTNSISVPYPQTNCTVSNLVSGTRYYFVAQATDGIDVSVYSNEANGKTKINPPTSLTVVAP